MTIDEKLKDRYRRAYNIVSELGGSYELIIQAAKDIKEEEEKAQRATDKSDIGGVYDPKTQKENEDFERKQAEEEQEWGKLDLGVPKKEKKDAD